MNWVAELMDADGQEVRYAARGTTEAEARTQVLKSWPGTTIHSIKPFTMRFTMAKSSKTQKTSGKMAGKSATKQALIQQTENPVVEAPVAFQPTATEKKPQGTVIEVNGFKFIRAD